MNTKSKALLGNRQLIFALHQGQSARFDPDAFRELAELAVQYGATHLHVGQLPFLHNSWMLPDNTDPYAAWCNCAPGLFRLCPPTELQQWIPIEQAKAAQEIIRTQVDIARGLGLNGVVDSTEPLWLPEEVYRAHPRWRGPQCELGRIAARPYFAPSIDEPEVLELYRRAMKEFCLLFPEVDQFSFLTNDSGAGISWSACLYPGMNGPTRWRTRDGGERIANWLNALLEGAREAGSPVRLNIFSAGLPPETVASARQKLPPGLFVRHKDGRGEDWEGGGAGLAAGIWSPFYPALNLGDPISFVAGLQSVYSNPGADGHRVRIGFGEADTALARTLIESYLENPGPGLVKRSQVLLRAAERFCGAAGLAEELVGVWEEVNQAVHAILQIRQKGFSSVIPFCCVSMRWLIRPLVPEPQKLTEEETAYYRSFLFTPYRDQQAGDFGFVLGKSVFRGASVMWMARWCLQEAIGTLRHVRETLKRLSAETKDKDAAARLSLLGARIGAFGCLAATVKNTIMYQYALDIASQPQLGPNPMDYDDNIIYDHRALTLRKIAREELDNITELIELIESQTEPVIEQARHPAEESVFMLGPDVRGDLRRKSAIMLNHWQDYERLYPSTRVWDFEPAPLI